MLALVSLLLHTSAAFVGSRSLPLARALPRHLQRSAVVARDIPLLEDTDAYHQLIEDATAENRIVVIKFYASWCRACKAMAPKFVRVAEDWPDIEFHELLFDDNKKLCKSLGIKILPFMEIVAGNRGKVEGFTCGPSKLSLLVGKLEDMALQYCEIDDIECTDVSGLLLED